MHSDLKNLLADIQALPYGRNSDRSNYQLVPIEQKGSCSTKHAYVKHIAEKNNWTEVKLMIGIYLMSEKNTPRVGEVLENYRLKEIPEAHTYLKIEGKIIDITGLPSAEESFEKTLKCSEEITLEQIGEYKVSFHKRFMEKWSEGTSYSAQELWEIREECIRVLSV